MTEGDRLAEQHFALVRRIARQLASKWGVGDPDAVESAAVYWLLRKSRVQPA